MIEIKKRPKKYNSEIRTITESHAIREEEERHQKLLRENDEFKNQLSEVCAFVLYTLLLFSS